MFTTEPAEYASFRDELIFEYTQDESSDLLFKIELGADAESKEVKKLYDVSNATINIAPIVAAKFMTTPSSGETTLETPECGYGAVTLKCGEQSTQTKYFVASKLEMPEVGVLSSNPTGRFISYGEADELWVKAQEGSLVEVCLELQDEGGTENYEFQHYVAECGFARFRFNTSDFSQYTKVAIVTVLCDGQSIETISYYYIPSVRGAVRLAWIGRGGGVEHYTFPMTNSLTLMRSGVRTYEVESAYESMEMVDSLSDILTSERLWIVEGEEYVEVQLLSDVVVLNKRGELSTVEYKFERYD